MKNLKAREQASAADLEIKGPQPKVKIWTGIFSWGNGVYSCKKSRYSCKVFIRVLMRFFALYHGHKLCTGVVLPMSEIGYGLT